MTQPMCVECHAQLKLRDGVLVGEIVQCPECGVELEVIALDPVRLQVAPEVEEDWGE